MNNNIIITSGKYRGRIIKSPKSEGTHPMGSREKLALFNMITDKIPGAEVLDAYAGSGALGIEAISRGAKTADFVEKDQKVAINIMNNLKSLGIDKADFFITPAEKLKTQKHYDVIFADPPYDKFSSEAIIYLTKFLKDGGVFVLSHPEPISDIPGLNLTKTRKYARAHISIYQKSA